MDYDNIAAFNFEKALPVPLKTVDVESIVNTIKKKFNKDELHMLDLGVGSGLFFIPLYREFRKEFDRLSVVVADQNVSMLNEFKENCQKNNIEMSSIQILEEDILNLNPDVYTNQNIIIMTRVLHQIKHWQNLLEKVITSICNNSIIIISESGGQLYDCLNFKRPVNSNKMIYLFEMLEKYFGEAYHYYIQDMDITAVNMDAVKKYFMDHGLAVEKIHTINWTDSKNTWEDYLRFIEYKVFTPITSPFINKQDLLDKKIKEFAAEVRDQFPQNGWDINEITGAELNLDFFIAAKQI